MSTHEDQERLGDLHSFLSVALTKNSVGDILWCLRVALEDRGEPSGWIAIRVAAASMQIAAKQAEKLRALGRFVVGPCKRCGYEHLSATTCPVNELTCACGAGIAGLPREEALAVMAREGWGIEGTKETLRVVCPACAPTVLSGHY